MRLYKRISFYKCFFLCKWVVSGLVIHISLSLYLSLSLSLSLFISLSICLSLTFSLSLSLSLFVSPSLSLSLSLSLALSLTLSLSLFLLFFSKLLYVFYTSGIRLNIRAKYKTKYIRFCKDTHRMCYKSYQNKPDIFYKRSIGVFHLFMLNLLISKMFSSIYLMLTWAFFSPAPCSRIPLKKSLPAPAPSMFFTGYGSCSI